MGAQLVLPMLLAAFAGGYLLGAIPFGLVLTRIAGLGDVRAIGSGNIGATNVLRTGRKGLAAATLLLDGLKGTAAVLLVGPLVQAAAASSYAAAGGAAIVPQPVALAGAAGLGAFLGHLYPVWLGFKGGKGVATYIGVLLGLAWKVAVLFCAVWLAVAYLKRFSSLSALTAALLTPPALFASGAGSLLVSMLSMMSLLLFWTHRENIRRLWAGTESKIGAKATPAGQSSAVSRG